MGKRNMGIIRDTTLTPAKIKYRRNGNQTLQNLLFILKSFNSVLVRVTGFSAMVLSFFSSLINVVSHLCIIIGLKEGIDYRVCVSTDISNPARPTDQGAYNKFKPTKLWCKHNSNKTQKREKWHDLDMNELYQVTC